MYQQRTRKAAAAEQGSRGRSTVKATGDQRANMKGSERKLPSGDMVGDVPLSNTQNKERSNSRSKIPKNLRNDLENALVGLCDVWFEEIKPHLVRNNIKLHVHGEGGGAASGDHQLAAGAPDCSHLDPASSAGVCELCQLLVNAANSIESAVSQAASAVTPPFVTSKTSPLPESANNLWSSRPASHPPNPPWKVLRLYNTYNPPAMPKQPFVEYLEKKHRKNNSIKVKPRDSYVIRNQVENPNFQRSNRKPSTATVVLPKQKKSQHDLEQSRVLHQGVSFRAFQEAVLQVPTTGPFQQENVLNTKNKQEKKLNPVSKKSHVSKHRKEVNVRKGRNELERTERKLAPRPHAPSVNTTTKPRRRPSKQHPNLYQEKPSSAVQHRPTTEEVDSQKSTLDSRNRRYTTATFHRPRIKSKLSKNLGDDPYVQQDSVHRNPPTVSSCLRCPLLSRTRSRWQLHHPPKLFQDDLINILAERSEQQLKVLFKSPNKDEEPSIMNLLNTNRSRLSKANKFAKKMPIWR